MEKIDPHQLFEELKATFTFGSGLPLAKDIKVPAIAQVFSAILRTGFIMETDYKDEEGKYALDKCFRHGWLHADQLNDFPGMQYKTGYLFPLPLHQWYVGWKLQETLGHNTFDAKDLLTFAVEVISH